MWLRVVHRSDVVPCVVQAACLLMEMLCHIRVTISNPFEVAYAGPHHTTSLLLLTLITLSSLLPYTYSPFCSILPLYSCPYPTPFPSLLSLSPHCSISSTLLSDSPLFHSAPTPAPRLPLTASCTHTDVTSLDNPISSPSSTDSRFSERDPPFYWEEVSSYRYQHFNHSFGH